MTINYSKILTYVGGLGLILVSVYQAGTRDFEGASQSFLAALGVLGLRQSVTKVKAHVLGLEGQSQPRAGDNPSPGAP